MAEKPTHKELEHRIQELEHAEFKRKRAEKALQESEERYRSVVEDLPVLVCSFLPGGEITFVNKAYCEYFGKTSEELVGTTFLLLIPEADQKAVMGNISALTVESQTQSHVHKVIAPNGDIRWQRWTNRAVFDARGHAVGYQSIGEDITDYKQAEAALRESEERYRQLVESTTDWIWACDVNGIHTYSNDAIISLLGYEPHEVVGSSSFDLMHPEDRERVKNWFREAVSQKMGWAGDAIRWLHRDGFVRFMESRAEPVLDTDGHLVGFSGIDRDITKRKQIEEALRDSEQRYSSLFKNNHSVMLLIDPETADIIDANPAASSFYGWSQEELTSRKITDINTLTQEKVLQEMERAKSEQRRHFYFRHRLASGEIRDVEVYSGPITVYRRQLLYSIIHDITERIRAEEDREKLKAQLERTQRMEAIATLAGGIAHEFNNALAGITANIELLDMDLPSDESVRNRVEPMKFSARRMARLTDQLLAYARGGKYQPRAISFNDLVEDTLSLLQHRIDPEIRAEMDLPHGISNVEADLTQMQMVLSAIVDNSIEAIEGKGRIRIITRNEDIDEEFAKHHPGLKPGPYVCLTIEDDGKGMDEETRTRVFEPFFTLKFQGRGLGMAAAHGIVKNHDGWIGVDSELGKGTVVRIYLPAIEVEVEEEKEPGVELGEGEGTILVIEDEETLMDLNRTILERLGYRILEARSGAEAVELARTFDGDIDLAILDIRLPDMPGNKVYQDIMEARSDLKVIVCSGYAADGPAQEILTAGAQGFIQKPYSLGSLSTKLNQVLEGSG
jgi:two-component system cell cycle sensor histidine kinase/response regulator CckA